MSGLPPGGNDWMEYRQYVIKKLDDLHASQVSVNDQLVLMRVDIAMLKVRSGIWGAIAGLIPATIGVIAVIFGTGAA